MTRPKTHEDNLHRTHYVYRCYNDNAERMDERLVYVGCSVDVKRRMAQHGTSGWVHLVTRVEWDEYPDKRSGLDAEARTIRNQRPLYNVQANAFRRFVKPANLDRPMTFQEAAGLSGMHISTLTTQVRHGLIKLTADGRITRAALDEYFENLPYWNAADDAAEEAKSAEYRASCAS